MLLLPALIAKQTSKEGAREARGLRWMGEGKTIGVIEADM